MSPDREYRVFFYETASGESPVDEFLDGLPIKVRAKVMKRIEQLETYGPTLPRPYADIVRGKIRELRVRLGNLHCRFLYFFFGKIVVLTQGFLKKQTEIPEGEISRAERCRYDFMIRLERGEIEI